MLPDEKTKCHRTGFEKGCRDMVVNCNCRAWVRVKGRHAETDAPVDLYDCADHWAPQIHMQSTEVMQKHLLTVAQSIDALRKEVAQTNDVHMVGAIARMNRDLEMSRGLVLNGSQTPLLERPEASELPSDGFSRLAPRKQDS